MRGSDMDNRTKNSISNIVKLCIFAVLAFFLFTYTTFVMTPFGTESAGMRGIYAERDDSLDVLYIGGSISIVNWIPYEAWEDYGIVSYVYGKSDLRSFNVEPMAKEALTNQSPELLIVDLRPFQYTTNEEARVANDIALEHNMAAWSPNRFDIIDNALAYEGDLTSADTKVSFIFDLIKSHGTWRSLTRNNFEYAIPGSKSSETKGFLPIKKFQKINLVDNSEITDAMPVSERAEADLRDFLNYVSDETNCRVLFVVTPYSETAGERRAYNYLAEIIDEYNFDYLNFNDLIDELGIDENHDFYDRDHMNIFGAEKYTKWLGQYIRDKYDISDRWNDPEYASYDDTYDEWVAISDKTKAAVQKLIDEEAAKNAG